MQRPTWSQGGATGGHHLQPVQDDELRRLNLPPSIPVSRDGEEGAAVYNLRLQQSNAEARSDCYQAPPNRTVDAGGADGLGAGGGGAGAGAGAGQGLTTSQHSTSTPSMIKRLSSPPPPPLPPTTLKPPPPTLTRRSGSASLAKFRSAMGSKPGKLQAQPPLPLEAEPPPHFDDAVIPAPVSAGAGAMVSPSGAGVWRTTSPDRSELHSKCIIPSMCLISWPYLTTDESVSSSSVGGATAASSDGTPGDEDAVSASAGTGKRQTKQRSSSADSVRRLVARCSFLRFAKKHATAKPTASNAPQTSQQHQPPHVVDLQQASDSVTGQLDERHSPGDTNDQEAPPWELPPNYVDMIFTKDPATIDNKKERIVKQQQQQQQQQRQQRQTQHCCFNS